MLSLLKELLRLPRALKAVSKSKKAFLTTNITNKKKRGTYSRRFVCPSAIPSDNCCPEHMYKALRQIAFTLEDEWIQIGRSAERKNYNATSVNSKQSYCHLFILNVKFCPDHISEAVNGIIF